MGTGRLGWVGLGGPSTARTQRAVRKNGRQRYHPAPKDQLWRAGRVSGWFSGLPPTLVWTGLTRLVGFFPDLDWTFHPRFGRNSCRTVGGTAIWIGGVHGSGIPRNDSGRERKKSTEGRQTCRPQSLSIRANSSNSKNSCWSRIPANPHPRVLSSRDGNDPRELPLPTNFSSTKPRSRSLPPNENGGSRGTSERSLGFARDDKTRRRNGKIPVASKTPILPTQSDPGRRLAVRSPRNAHRSRACRDTPSTRRPFRDLGSGPRPRNSGAASFSPRSRLR